MTTIVVQKVHVPTVVEEIINSKLVPMLTTHFMKDQTKVAMSIVSFFPKLIERKQECDLIGITLEDVLSGALLSEFIDVGKMMIIVKTIEKTSNLKNDCVDIIRDWANNVDQTETVDIHDIISELSANLLNFIRINRDSFENFEAAKNIVEEITETIKVKILLNVNKELDTKIGYKISMEIN